MSTKEIKAEIQKVIEHVPDSALSEILSYLKQIESSSIGRSENIGQIFKEDKGLLEKLAQ